MKKKIIATMMCAVLACTSLASFAAASEPITDENIVVASTETQRSTRAADLIIYYYKTVNGNVYIKRWNDTQGYWIDSDWVYLCKAS